MFELKSEIQQDFWALRTMGPHAAPDTAIALNRPCFSV